MAGSRQDTAGYLQQADKVAAPELMMANPKVKLQPYKIVCPFFVLFSSESLRVGSEGLWLLPKSKCTFVTD